MINLNQHSPGYEQDAPRAGQGFEGDEPESFRNKSCISSSDRVDKPSQRPKAVARFDFTDRDGNPSYYKVRFEPGEDGRRKSFGFFHGNGQLGRGGEPLLYNLPRVLESGVVFITEGEAKADLLNSWGFCATTLDAGAGSKLTDEMVEQLSGRHIIVLRDNDEPGLKFAENIAQALFGHCPEVKLILLPGLEEKGDIIDWAKVPGNDWERLTKIVERAEAYQIEGAESEADIEVVSWPTLDKKALHGLAGEVVELATRNSEADPAAVLATLLVWFAAEVGPSPFMMIGDSKHFARLATVIVGGSSKARKGTSAKPIERLFSFNSSDYRRARISPGPLSSGEGLVYAVRDAVREWVVVDKKTQQYDWVVTDPGEDDKRLIVIDEEFGAGLSCTKREGNTLSTIMRQSWDYGTIEPLTKTKRIKATGAHINIVTHITIAELKQKLHETEALNGFGNRFLWVCARRNGIVSRPMPMPEDEVLKLRHKIVGAARTAQSDNMTMQFSDATWSMWDEVYPELSRDHAGLAGVIVNRAEAQAIRLSMVYALLDESNTIEPHHLEAALAFWKYCEDSAMFIFGGREQDTVADKIIEALRKKDLSSTEISDLFAHNISSERIKAALRDLSSSGRVTSRKVTKKTGGPTDTKKTGRPTVMYTLVEREEKNNPNEKNEINEISTPTSKVNSFNSFNSSDEVEL